MTKPNHLSSALAAVLASTLAACGGQVTSDPAGQGISVTVSPAEAHVGPGESLALDATVTGTANTMVVWSVLEGAAGGTVDSGGLYTAPAADGTYHVVVASSADPTKSATATVTVSPLPPPPPPPDGTMRAANRTSGVAPLAVFFDAVDTVNEGSTWPFVWTSGVRQPSDMEGAHFAWDFGDPRSGTWSTTGRSKNTAIGYTAAHVYEVPGTYTVTLVVTDTDGTVSSYGQTITVTAFGGTTHYASATGTGDGTSEATPSSLAAGWAWVNGGANRRLLLKRGDTFVSGDISTNRSYAGNIVGAYGTGERPIIRFNAESANIYVQSADWRFMDLDLVSGGGSSTGAIELAAHIKTDNNLALRVRSTGFSIGLGNSIYDPIRADPHDGIAWVECEINGSGGMGLYTGGRRVIVLGNYSHGTGSHNLRLWHGIKAVVSNNRLWGTTGTYQCSLKLHGPEHGGPEAQTRWVTVTDNIGMINAPWTFSIGPENAQSDQRVTHLLFERNHLYGDPTTHRTQAGMEISSRNTMIRNNILEGTGGASGYAGVLIQRRGIEPVPQDVRVLNNTVVRIDSAVEFSAVDLATSGSSDIVVRSNVAWAPSASTRTLVNGSATNLVVNGNLAVTIDPLFANQAGGDFTLQAASPAVDASSMDPEVRTDFNGVSRPRGSAVDLGAIESH